MKTRALTVLSALLLSLTSSSAFGYIPKYDYSDLQDGEARRTASPEPVSEPENLTLTCDLCLPGEWMRLGYANGNPLRYTDPTGEAVCAGSKEQCQALYDQAVRLKGLVPTFQENTVVNSGNNMLMIALGGGFGSLEVIDPAASGGALMQALDAKPYQLSNFALDSAVSYFSALQKAFTTSGADVAAEGVMAGPFATGPSGGLGDISTFPIPPVSQGVLGMSDEQYNATMKAAAKMYETQGQIYFGGAALGTGIQLLAVAGPAMIGKPPTPPLAATGAKGPVGLVSGRPFNPNAAGGAIRNLDYAQVKVTPKGVAAVEAHVRRFAPPGSEELKMVERLKAIAGGQAKAEAVDLRFYTHELRESVRYRRLGYPKGQPADADAAYELWNDAHTATLEDYSLKEGPGVLFHPSVEGK